MKDLFKLASFACWILMLSSGPVAQATLVISDQYDVTGSGTGFTLGSGLNSGINPPTTRLTGSEAANLRYIQTAGSTRGAALHYITNNTKMAVGFGTSSTTLALSDGSGVYNFGPALHTAAATPATPESYDLTINIANATASGNQRCSFGFSSTSGNAAAWDFGIQIYHANSGDSFYTLQKRVRKTAAGLGADLNAVAGTVGTYPTEVAFLIRVTDAGLESGANYHSRVQVSVDGGSTWVYDTATDVDLPGGIQFAGLGRYVVWDVAPNAGPVTYDNLSLTWNSGPTAGERVWTGGGALDNNWSTSANWSSGVPATGDSLVFNGATRQTNTNDLSGLSVTSLTLSNGGFNLFGNALVNVGVISNVAGINTLGLELDWTSLGSTWNLAAGSELVLNNTISIESTVDNNFNSGGTLRLKGAMAIGQITTAAPVLFVREATVAVDGGNLTTRGGIRIGSSATTATAPQVILTNGGSVTLTISASGVRVGDSANPLPSTLKVNNSTLTLSGGSIGIPFAAGATGVVNQVGGLVAGGRINFSQSGAGMGTFNLSNGTLEALQVLKTTAGGVAQMYFNNAILRTANGASNALFMSGLDVAEIQPGGLTLDATATDVVIDQVLSGSGVLTKSGTFTTTLTGTNSYTGNTIVQAGRLVLPTVQSNAAAIQVADYAELGVLAVAPGTSLAAGSLSLGGGNFSTLSIDLATGSNPTAALIKVGSLTASGPVVVNIANGLYLNTGRIVLVDYSGAIGGGGYGAFQLGSLPAGVTASLVNNTTNSSIDLDITGVPGFRWTGNINGDWDYATANWINAQTGLPANYSDGYPLSFLDNAATGIINLTAFPTPSSMLISNNVLAYVVSGGALTTPLVQKDGSASLTRVGGEADFIDLINLNHGSFISSNLFDATFTTKLDDDGNGAGAFVKAGPTTLTLSGNNATFNGAITIAEGTLKPTIAAAVGTTNGTTSIAAGATLDVNNVQFGDEPVIVTGAGVSGQGAIIDSTASTAVIPDLKDVTMTGDTVFGAPNGGRWDLRVNSSTGAGPGLRGNGHKLTKVGSGMVSIGCSRSLGVDTPYWQMNLGDILVSEGNLAFAEALSLGNPSASLTVSAGATLQIFDLGLTNALTRNVIMTDATLISTGGTTGTNGFNGTFQLNGTNTFVCNQACLIINSSMSGPGSFTTTATSPGSLILNGTNSAAGDTTISSGTLGGNGRITANLNVSAGTLAPGFGGLGTFTVVGNATLGATTQIEIDRSQSPNSDRLVVGGTLSFGGVLNVVLGPGAAAPQAGDVYQLFSKGSASAFTQVNLPDISSLPGGLTWNTSNLAVDGTISVTGTAASPVISTVWSSGSQVGFSGTGGIAGNTYYVLGATNVTTPMVDWTRLATNVFGSGGSFGFTNTLNATTPAYFFRLQLQ